jgi:hypothetical protein
MWYGFNDKGKCLFSADGRVQEEKGVTVVESDVVYKISSIRLIDGEIREPPPVVEVIEEEKMPTEQVELYDAIAGIYELLEGDKK